MKLMKLGAFFVFLTLFNLYGGEQKIYQMNIPTYEKGQRYLDKLGEVCVEIPFTNKEELHTLTEQVSIDRITNNNSIIAYANRHEFEALARSNREYRIAPHSSDIYSDIKMFEGEISRYDYKTYPKYEDYLKLMEKFAADYPNLCRLQEIGTSIQGRKIIAAIISDNVNKQEAEPQFLYTSTIHGDELVGYVLLLRLIDYLLSNYQTDERVTAMVQGMELWIAPNVNPDGTYRGGNHTVMQSIRGNSTGQDLNRDFPSPFKKRDNWRAQKETELLIKLGDEQNFVLSSDIHSGAEVVCYPWGCKKDRAADDNWWKLISLEYANHAIQNSPSSYFKGVKSNGIVNGYDWYPVIGERMNYALYYQQSRLLTLEFSQQKKLAESQLDAHWGYNKEAMLSYIEQTNYGIIGTVTSSDGTPLKAKIFVEGHDKDNSHVYSNDKRGGVYRRPIFKGTYKVTFSAEGHQSKTIENVTVKNGEGTELNIRLWKDGTSINHTMKSNSYLNGLNIKQGKVSLPSLSNNGVVTLIKTNGQTVQSWNVQKNIKHLVLPALAKGNYILRLSTKNLNVSKKILIP